MENSQYHRYKQMVPKINSAGIKGRFFQMRHTQGEDHLRSFS